jgi:galactokinase
MTEVHADAPGRVNLIGEHTDYHEGFVLPCAVPQRTYATVRRRTDTTVRAWSAQMPATPVQFAVGSEQRGTGWGDYVQGLTWILSADGFTLGGFDLQLNSEVPLGSGLSSSAAMEIAILRALRLAFDLPLSEVQLARIAQRAEVEFVGAPVGIMDQMAASLAGEREALFLDTRTLTFERIPLPRTLELVVINSGVAHQHAGGDYITRRRESELAAQLLGVTYLRDAGPGALDQLAALPQVLARRARHVITENQRVLRARAAMLREDLGELGALFNASHASMRDDYEVSIPAIDVLVELAQRHDNVFGARLTGGGFGGAVVIAVRAGSALEVARDVSAEYARGIRLRPDVLVPRTN